MITHLFSRHWYPCFHPPRRSMGIPLLMASQELSESGFGRFSPFLSFLISPVCQLSFLFVFVLFVCLFCFVLLLLLFVCCCCCFVFWVFFFYILLFVLIYVWLVGCLPAHMSFTFTLTQHVVWTAFGAPRLFWQPALSFLLDFLCC